MYEPLLIFNPLTGAFVPWLAEGYEFAGDHRRLSFQIRRGVTWSDGRRFTARDVAFTFELLKKFPALDLRNFWQYLAEVRVTGDDAVEFRFARPFVPGLEDISSQPIVPEHAWKDVADPIAFANEQPVATGPFSEHWMASAAMDNVSFMEVFVGATVWPRSRRGGFVSSA